MKSHALRLKLLVGLTLAFAAAALSLFMLGMWSDAASGVFGTALTLLVPAVIDATQVEGRRRNPAAKAISDDVTGG